MLDLKKLKIIREKRQLTQVAVAKKIGITPAHYCNIESGLRGASLETIEAILKVLDIAFEELQADDPIAADHGLPGETKDIVIENEDGRHRTRYILPPTPATYALIDLQMKRPASHHDSEVRELLKLWKDADNADRAQFWALLRELLQELIQPKDDGVEDTLDGPAPRNPAVGKG